MPRPADPCHNERGIALVVVLWTLVMLAMLTIGFSLSSRTEARVAANGAEEIRLRALLRGGVELAVLGLGTADDDRGWRADGTPYPAEIGDDRIVVRIRDEAGRIDLNRADAETLQRLIAVVLGTPESAQRLAEAILRRRGGDQAAAGRAPGTEPAGQAPNAPPRPPTQPDPANPDDPARLVRPFQSAEELRRVPGIGRALADALMPHVTVLSPAAGINPFAADPVVLQALPGVTRAQAEAVVRARQQRPPPTPERLASLLPRDLAERLRGTAGPIYSITVEAATARGARGRVEAVIWVAADAQSFYRVLDWREAGFGRPEREDPQL
ncbi:general secretion pathway protein GspK [Inquilinus limosus]|uniref:general secretion pathway protein GspK n=1 Tax=Inquilinus limosus TaxID=171674 RepID=UPI00047B2A65|nr:type II secretion system protein GspK [Inquilinus limosus]